MILVDKRIIRYNVMYYTFVANKLNLDHVDC